MGFRQEILDMPVLMAGPKPMLTEFEFVIHDKTLGVSEIILFAY